nr:hypothetical protein [uncultured Prevotella sp.]
MAVVKKNIGTVDLVSSMLRTNSVYVEIDGSTRRITLDNLMDSINSGNEQLLRQVAWGVPIKQASQSSPAWGTIGNTTMWEQFKESIGDYLLTTSGKAAKLSATDRTIFADGTTVDETKGNVMFHAPKLYYLVQTDAITGIPYLWMSMYPIGGFYIEASWIGAYMGYNLNGTLVSRSGYTPTGMQTVSSFWNLAHNNGKDFGLTNYDHHRLMMMLNLSEYGNPNAQANIGYGCSGDGNTWDKTNGLKTGATSGIGDACGKISIADVAGNANASRVSLFGIEDAWGWYWQMIQSIFFGNSANAAQNGSEAFIYEGNRMPTAAELTTAPVGNYRQATRLTTPTEGWVQNMLMGGYFDLIPSKIGGDSNSYWTDYSYQNTTGQLCLFGGNAFDGALGGLAYVNSRHAFSRAHALCGARLAYYGNDVEIVNGADL